MPAPHMSRTCPRSTFVVLAECPEPLRPFTPAHGGPSLRGRDMEPHCGATLQQGAHRHGPQCCGRLYAVRRRTMGRGVGSGGVVPWRGNPAGGRQGAWAGWGLLMRWLRRLAWLHRCGRTRTAPRGCTSHRLAESGARVLRSAPRFGGEYARRRTGGRAGRGWTVHGFAAVGFQLSGARHGAVLFGTRSGWLYAFW